MAASGLLELCGAGCTSGNYIRPESNMDINASSAMSQTSDSDDPRDYDEVCRPYEADVAVPPPPVDLTHDVQGVAHYPEMQERGIYASEGMYRSHNDGVVLGNPVLESRMLAGHHKQQFEGQGNLKIATSRQ